MLRVQIEPMSPIILPVQICGRGRIREVDALLDTGASYLVIATQDAIDLGHDLTLAPKLSVVTANGLVQAPLIVVESVQLGPYTARDVQTLCLDMVGDRISSLLGLSLLSRFRLVLDYKSSPAFLAVQD
ncbi:MAG TPA: retropepsin-like aspartic protease [Thermoanaerobaculia bacterium]|nr:retropepsin-like aspartic protease [Thermoanaerobaculia bacterium]